jgi:NADH:ubiquinone oxidoreductase subunit 2 (subunit N)
LIGVPPLLGFWGKYYLFYLTVKFAFSFVWSQSLLTGILFIAPIIIIFSSVLSAYGYLILLKNMYT